MPNMLVLLRSVMFPDLIRLEQLIVWCSHTHTHTSKFIGTFKSVVLNVTKIVH